LRWSRLRTSGARRHHGLRHFGPRRQLLEAQVGRQSLDLNPSCGEDEVAILVIDGCAHAACRAARWHLQHARPCSPLASNPAAPREYFLIIVRPELGCCRARLRVDTAFAFSWTCRYSGLRRKLRWHSRSQALHRRLAAALRAPSGVWPATGARSAIGPRLSHASALGMTRQLQHRARLI